MTRRVITLCIALGVLLPLPLKRTAHPVESAGEPLQSMVLQASRPSVSLPLSFEINRGQVDTQVKFLARMGRGTAFLTPGGATLVLWAGAMRGPTTGEGRMPPPFGDSLFHRRTPRSAERTAVISMTPVGGNARAKLIGVDRLPGVVSYLIGNDRRRWHRDIRTYARVLERGVYPGINLVYYGNEGGLEDDWIVQPSADPRRIVLRIQGPRSLHTDRDGNLLLTTAVGTVRESPPRVYQLVHGRRQPVAGRYVLAGGDQIGFRLGGYDRTRPLIIDPVLLFATYLGGSAYDELEGVTVDADGNAYVCGYTESMDFPTVNPFSSSVQGKSDAVVSKLNPSGTALLYSTYLGGLGDENAAGIAVDGTGSAYIVGYTSSLGYLTKPPAQPLGLQDAFVAKLTSSGDDLVYSTLIGSSQNDWGNGIAVNAAGEAYAVGEQSTVGGDAFVVKLDVSGKFIADQVFSGNQGDVAYGVALDAEGNVYVTGITSSTDFPRANALQSQLRGPNDAFLVKLDASLTTIEFSTYLGGSLSDSGNAVVTDQDGNVYVIGNTQSSDLPGRKNVAGPGGEWDAFVMKLNSTGSAILYCATLGGTNDDHGAAGAIDANGDVFVTGYTASKDLGTVNAVQPALAGNTNAFVAELDPTGTSPIYSTYLGGSVPFAGTGTTVGDEAYGLALGPDGSAYVVGQTNSKDFPVTVDGYQRTIQGNYDAFIARLGEPSPSATATPSATPVPPTPTATATPTSTPTSSPTSTPVDTPTGTSTATSTETSTPVPPPTVTSTPRSTATATFTATPRPSPTWTPTEVPPPETPVIHLKKSKITSGSKLKGYVLTSADAQIDITLTVRQHKQTLYRREKRGSTGSSGRFDFSMKVTFQPEIPTHALLVVSAQTAGGSTVNSVRITIQPSG